MNNFDSKTDKKLFWFYGFSFLVRLAFAIYVPLIDDEAYHWSWTQDLSLSYYDHPGMIAWLEYISTHLFGPTYWGVRAPSFFCFWGTVYIAFKLAKELFNEWAGHFVAFMLLWTPFWGFGGYVASPEPPFMFFWISSAYIFWQGARDDENQWSLAKTWTLLGITMGLGLNSKFIIALLAPGFGLYLLTSQQGRKALKSPWPWVGFGIATLLCFPIFKWNTEFDWPGFKYQFHDRHQDGDFSLQRYLGFLSAQILFLTPVGYWLMILSAINGFKHFLSQNKWRFIICLAFPSITLFYTQALFSDFKPHWSGAAYLLLTLGSGAIWSQGLILKNKIILKPFSPKIVWGLMIFILPINIFLYSSFVYPWIPKAYRIFSSESSWNPQWDLSNEFFGWEEAGAYLNKKQIEIEKITGKKPFLAAHRYETTAQAYWGSQQKVITLNRTRSHYTVMTSEAYLNSLKGQDALVIHSDKYQFDPHSWIRWDSCEKEELKTYRQKELSRIFTIYHCKNFQGLKE